MGRKELVNEIINFYIEYKIINIIDVQEVICITEKELQNCDFIENLINMILLRTRCCGNIDTEKIIGVLLELERIRLELEYYDK